MPSLLCKGGLLRLDFGMALRFPDKRPLGLIMLAAVLAAVVPAIATAQEDPQAQDDPHIIPPKQKAPPGAPGKLPRVDRGRNLDFLFGALKAAPDEISAKHVEARIWAIWLQTPSDTAGLLMTRAKAAMDAHQMDVAIKLLDAVIKLRPDYTEAWNRRATLYYLKNDYGRSLADIEEVLIREPRHFAALAGLGMIMQDLGDDKRALDAYRKALDINPHIEKVPEIVKTLTEKVEGRDI